MMQTASDSRSGVAAVADASLYHDFTEVLLKVRSAVIGVAPDSVYDVLTLSGDMIKPSPTFEVALDTRHISGLAPLGGRMLMNKEAQMSDAEMGLLATNLY
jgi:purine-binding chemotaxis protein CheW